MTDPGAHYADRKSITDRLPGSARLVSNSEIQAFLRCRRKWWLAWYRGMRLKNEKPTGVRSIGDRMHRALAQWYVPVGQVDPRDALEALITSDYAAVVQSLETQGGVDSAPGLIAEFRKDADLERVMMEGYVEWLRETGADAGFTVIASEQYIETLIDEHNYDLPVYIIGKLDAKVQQHHSGHVQFMDHKFVGEFGTRTATLHMDPQMKHYSLIDFLNQPEAERIVTGALYNMVKRSKRTARAKPPFYQRLDVHFNESDMESYLTILRGIIQDMRTVEIALSEGWDTKLYAYPRVSVDCRWDCDFFAICPLFDNGSNAEGMLDVYYTKIDPLSYYTEDTPNDMA